MTITAETLVSREVYYCVSSLIHSLAKGYGGTNEELGDIAEQAFELARPIDDYESAGLDAGWTLTTSEAGVKFTHADGETLTRSDCGDLNPWHHLCMHEDLEPYEREVYEHWIVSDWLADQLIKRGEKVDKDFCGLTVWARTTTGQAIASDCVIDDILRELAEA